jgi:hypothetical protein
VADDLVSGVLTRISEIEREALAISAGRLVEGMAGRRVDPDLNRYLDTICDPDEVLRLCRAHRQIVEEHAPRHVASLDADTWGQGAEVCRRCAIDDRRVVFPCPTLRALAVGLGVVEEDR